MKLVQQAKEYVKKHEGQLQERLAMSKSTRDIMARFHIVLVKVIQKSNKNIVNALVLINTITVCCENVAMATQ